MDKTIALYMRLSDEDDNLAAHEESNSISHQRKLMLDHIQKLPELKDCNIMEFSDDGYSGADFSRPNFVKMMDLVKAGKIQVIVTKDYSRLGRDYLEVGNYMECIFPVLQVRYISVNDNYDSANSFGSTGGMSVALKNLVNALYCKDASKKVRAAKAVLAKQGKYIAAFAPFGYQKSEDDKHMLVPDPVTAPVVQLIFELAIKGMKYTEIANYLNNNGYDSIFEYYQKIGVKRCYERDIGEHMWSASTVMEILYNEVYIGSVINNKTADNIDTGHQVVQRDKEDWIIVENCHEPLVSVEDFKLAHKMIARREVTKRKPNGKWRKSYIRCGICGKGLYKYGNKSSYRCHNGHVSRIRGEELEATLLDIARNMALAQLQEFELKTDGGNCPDNLEREIESLKKSKAHYAKLKFEIYDDYTKTNITRDQMAKKTAEVKQKIAEIESLITEKQETLDMQKDLFLDAKQEQLTKLSKLDEFDEEVIRYLIDYVLVYDNEHIEIRFSRTNRLFGPDKPFGTIRYYRKPHTMEKNINDAVELYSGDRPLGLFVQHLPENLEEMNGIFAEISELFENAGVTNFEKLPEDKSVCGRFAKEFNRLNSYLEAAKIQGFKWSKPSYVNENTGEIIDVCIDEKTYLILVLRYKELGGNDVGMSDGDAPYDLEGYITEIDTGLIDSDYMNSRFDKYIKLLYGEGSTQETVDQAETELHKTFATLSQEEQKYANIFLHDIQRGDVEVTVGKSLRDYINEYMSKAKDNQIHQISFAIGVDEEKLRIIMDLKLNDTNINEFGRYEELRQTIDKNRAKEYFERIEGRKIIPPKVNIKVDKLLREFIIRGGFEIQMPEEYK